MHIRASLHVLALICIVTLLTPLFTVNELPKFRAAHLSETEINFVYFVAGSLGKQSRAREIDG
jgi:hypothetical protein